MLTHGHPRALRWHHTRIVLWALDTRHNQNLKNKHKLKHKEARERAHKDMQQPEPVAQPATRPCSLRGPGPWPEVLRHGRGRAQTRAGPRSKQAGACPCASPCWVEVRHSETFWSHAEKRETSVTAIWLS